MQITHLGICYLAILLQISGLLPNNSQFQKCFSKGNKCYLKNARDSALLGSLSHYLSSIFICRISMERTIRASRERHTNITRIYRTILEMRLFFFSVFFFTGVRIILHCEINQGKLLVYLINLILSSQTQAGIFLLNPVLNSCHKTLNIYLARLVLGQLFRIA